MEAGNDAEAAAGDAEERAADCARAAAAGEGAGAEDACCAESAQADECIIARVMP